MQQSNSSKKVKYVIVGGGLSGLSAGRKLQKELHI
jgi:protoporphyrinogen oxidase